jgi:hypothetical protein
MNRLLCWLIGHKEQLYEGVVEPVVLISNSEPRVFPSGITLCGLECSRCGTNLTPEVVRVMYHTVAPLDLEL